MSKKFPLWRVNVGPNLRSRVGFHSTLRLGSYAPVAKVPQGVIAVWTGLLANIPTGWNLCDGAGGRPNLLGYFVRGSDAGVDPGGTGGSNTHSHTEPGSSSHNHTGTSGSDGTHQHTTPTSTGDHQHGTVTTALLPATTWPVADNLLGSHNHTWVNEGAHTHTINSQSHSHTPTSVDDGRPTYYEVAFILSDGTGTLSSGVIVLWSGLLANIPANFSLCDGGDTRPNLIARFLRGAPLGVNPGTTGGSDNHTHVTIPNSGAHTHTLEATLDHTHTSNSAGNHSGHGSLDYAGGATGTTSGAGLAGGSHTHTCGASGGHSHTTDDPGNHTHVMNTADGRPSYLELAPIIASAGATLTTGLICLWTGLLVNIPAGWSLCDGGGGRPDMRSRFHRGINTAVTNPGGTGGSDTHTHTVQAAGGHGHTHDLQGAHTHAAVDGSWLHNHGSKGCGSGSGASPMAPNANAGASHNHGALSNTGGHNAHTVTAQAAHSDHVYNATSSFPSYYDVAFIWKN